MAVYNYAESFSQMIQDKYKAESLTNDIVDTNPQIKFINAQTIKVPELTLGGYGPHDRSKLGFSTSAISNNWEPYKLSWDRDVEYTIDPMDVDETNLTVTVTNIQRQFDEDVKMPELDKYRFSKLYKEAGEKGAKIDTEALTEKNILSKFDDAMMAMDDAEVKPDGRILYVTPKVNKMLKNAEGIQRYLEVSGAKNVNRTVHSLDDVKVVVVPSNRLKTAYEDKGEGAARAYVPTTDAKQINFVLVEPTAIVCVDKYSYIGLFTPGHDARTGDSYVYQNRSYGDLFVIKAKSAGVYLNVDAA